MDGLSSDFTSASPFIAPELCPSKKIKIIKLPSGNPPPPRQTQEKSGVHVRFLTSRATGSRAVGWHERFPHCFSVYLQGEGRRDVIAAGKARVVDLF